jgi:hypothetical protein
MKMTKFLFACNVKNLYFLSVLKNNSPMKTKLFIFCASALMLLLSLDAFAQVTLSPKTDFTSGVTPQHIAFGDINGDGKLDMVVVNAIGNTFSVFLNTTSLGASTPTFSAKTDISTASNPCAVLLGDINNDGKLDVTIVNSGGNSFSVFLNTTATGAATATFSAKTDFATGTLPFFGAIGDLNGDGKLDIAVANGVGSTVSVLLNTTTTGAATPTFTAATDFTAGNGVICVAIGDLNNDGKSDLAVLNYTASTVSVLFNTTTIGSSTPSFSAKTDFAVWGNSRYVTIGDINLDGKADLIVTSTLANRVSVLINTTAAAASTPTFLAKTDFTASEGSRGVTVGDFNCDGKPDLAVANYGFNTLSVFVNTTTPGATTPTFTAKNDFTTGNAPFFPALADLNGDGRVDIAVANGSSASVSVYMNTMTIGVSEPAFDPKTDFSTGSAPWYDIMTDVNNDGKDDIAFVNRSGNTVSIIMNTTTPGATTPVFSSRVNFTTGALPQGVSAPDINKDGNPDLVVANSNSSSVSVFINTTTPGSSTPTYSAKTDFTTGSGPFAIAVGDFNLDGKPDFATVNNTANTVSVLLNTTTPGASTPTFSAKTDFAAGTAPNSISVTDINGDSKPDILFANQTSSTVSVIINTMSPGASTPTFSAKTDLSAGSTPLWIATADIDIDGKKDIIYTTTASTVSVCMNTTTPGASTPTFSAKTDFTTGTTPQSVSVGDLNGDGKPDLAVSNFSSNTVSILLNTTTPALSPMTSTPSFTLKTDYATGSSPRYAGIKDVNNDGKPDLIVVNQISATVSVLLNSAVLPLPVEMSSFTSSVKGNDVTLNWSTVQEQNNKGFEVERNSFGTGWKKVGYIEGNGTINHTQNYTFTERGLQTGSYKYRLKQIDYNGNFEYHELNSEVIIGVPNKFALAQNYPNPFNPATRINYELPITNYVTLKVYDISGKEVAILVNEVKEAGYYSVQFDAKSLSSGTYFYKLSMDKFSDVKKMVVVK